MAKRRRTRRWTVLRCGGCPRAERWPIPYGYEAGRCTCHSCGGQLVDRDDTGPDPDTIFKLVDDPAAA